ncbi:hypothetical protein GCM10029992_60600 [Glycomyces albus]
MQQTGSVITAAAAILIVVVGAFATGGITFMKMIGLGMAVAIFLDATVVRMLLVPATMRLLGRANWWVPGPWAACTRGTASRRTRPSPPRRRSRRESDLLGTPGPPRHRGGPYLFLKWQQFINESY